MLNKYAVATGQALQQTPESLAVLAGSKPESKVLAGIGSAAKGFSEGYGQVRQGQIAEQQAVQKAESDRLNNINTKLRPIVSEYRSDEDIKDEKARSEAIANIKNLLENPQDFQNINMADVMKSYLVQAYKPQYKRLAESGDIASISAAFNSIVKEGGKKVVGDIVSGVAGKGTFGADDAVELLRIIKPLEEQGSKNYDKYTTKYNNMFNDVGLTAEGITPDKYIDKLDWGGNTDEILKQYQEQKTNETPKETPKNEEINPSKLPEGATGIEEGTNKPTIVKGGKWTYQ
jgi:hypothetical protein